MSGVTKGNKQPSKGMILLNPVNKVLQTTVLDALEQVQENPEIIGQLVIPRVDLCDFDGVSYCVSIAKETPNILVVSMAMPCFGQISGLNALAPLESEYKGMIAEPESGFDVTLNIDLSELDGVDAAALAEKVALVKTNTLGCVFEKALTCIDGKGVDSFKFDYRDDTTIYFVPGDNRCTIIFSLDFAERVDRALAATFFKEFAQAKRDRALGRAPPVEFYQEPPRELEAFGITEPSGRESHVGYLAFAVLAGHAKGEQRIKTIRTLQTFRNYIQYHMKCAKSYFHSRMRAKCVDLLKVLNRAKMVQGEKKKKTMSGKTFQRG